MKPLIIKPASDPVAGSFLLSQTQKQVYQIYRKKTRFPNPIHQNKLHVAALCRLLGLSEENFRPVVIFIDNTDFKSALPDNTRGLIQWIKKHPDGILTKESFQTAAAALDNLDRTTNRRVATRELLKALAERHPGRKRKP